MLEYKAAADVTMKRKAEDDEEEKPDVKKIKVEDVEAESSKKKKKKKDKVKDGHERGVRPRRLDEAQARGQILQQLGGEWSGE